MRAAVILSGCGYLDGAEIRESVLSLLYLDIQDVEVEIFAPDISQHHVVNHVSCETETGGRNIMQEAARIARSKIAPLSALKADQFDFLVIPGGFGVAKNLSDFAFKGQDASLLPDFSRVIGEFYAAKKVIVAICIAPAVLALALKNKGITLTVGEDAATAGVIEASGNKHKICASAETCVDEKNRVITCSAYMRDDAIAPIAKGIEASINQAVAMARQAKSAAAA